MLWFVGSRWLDMSWVTAWRNVMAAYSHGDYLLPAGWLPVHQDQLRAQLSVTSMGELYFTLLPVKWVHCCVDMMFNCFRCFKTTLLGTFSEKSKIPFFSVKKLVCWTKDLVIHEWNNWMVWWLTFVLYWYDE